MRVRKAGLHDLFAIQNVARVLRVPGIEWADWHTAKMIRLVIVEGRYYCAEVNGLVVGAMSIQDCSSDELEIGTLAVRRSAQGLGVGTRLVGFAKMLARRRNKRMLVVSSACMYEAGAFYEKVGFDIRASGAYRGRRWREYAMKV